MLHTKAAKTEMQMLSVCMPSHSAIGSEQFRTFWYVYSPLAYDSKYVVSRLGSLEPNA